MFGMKGNSIEEHAKFEPEHSESEELRSEWYFSREEIENSQSRKDGIDLKRETYYQRCYSTFLQDLGMRLGLPQITIATATTLCHRFFQRQSHAKNDRTTIAIACMFLAGKAEDTPLPVNEVILKSCEILSRKNPRLREQKTQMDFCEEQRERVFNAERMVLITLAFDVNVLHPYRIVRTAIKKFGIDEECLTQVAWNFMNDGLRTSLWLQFKPREIAAGTIFLAARFLRVKLPPAWWRDFDVSPGHLKEVSDQLLELYEQMNVTAASHGNQPGRSGNKKNQMLGKSKSNIEVTPSGNNYSQVAQVDWLAAAWNGTREPQASDAGDGRKAAVQDGKYTSKDAKDKSGASVDRPTDKGRKITDVSTFNTQQVNEANTESVERQGSKIHCDTPWDETRGRVLCYLAQDSGPSAKSKCTRNTVASVGQHKPDRKKLSHESSPKSNTPQVDEVDTSILKQRQSDKLDVDKLGGEPKGVIQSSNDKQFSSINISYVNKEKVAEPKRKNLLREGRNSKLDISESIEVKDAEALIKFELERGVEDVANAAKVREGRKKDSPETCYRFRKESPKSRKEYAGNDSNSFKRKRSSEDISNKDIISEKNREYSVGQSDLCDQGQEMVPADELHDELEEGEIPNSPAEESVHSLKASDSLSQVSKQTNNGKDSIKWRDFCEPEPCRNRIGSGRSLDQRGSRHSSYSRQMGRNYRQGRDHGMDWEKPTDRNWEEQRDRGRDWKRLNDRDWDWEEQSDRSRDRKRPTDRSWEEQSYKRRRHDNGK